MERILLIEPDAEQAAAFFRLLPFEVIRVPDLQTAIDRTEQESFRVILLNVPISTEEDIGLYEKLSAIQPGKLVRTSSRREGDQELMLQDLDVLQDLESVRMELLNGEKLLALGQIASGITHDFNNIMTLILAHADYLLSFDEARADEDELKQSLTNIKHATETASLIVERLRAFYQPSEADTSHGVQNLAEVVRHAVELTRVKWHNTALSEGKLIRTRLELEQEDACWVSAPRVELVQVITNLIFNAVSAIATKGEISLSTFLDGEAVVLVIEDDGRGMTTAQLENCFQPFYTTSQSGTGIGLTMVRRYVEANNGTISLTSEPGKGTRFELRFPRALPAPAIEQSKPVSHAGSQSKKILIVDDEPGIREILSLTLSKLGHETIEAGSAEEGFRLLKGVDLIISDCLMPEVGGNEFARQLLSIAPDIPVFLLSGDQNALNMETPDNVRGLIMKPFDIHDLRDAIDLAEPAG